MTSRPTVHICIRATLDWSDKAAVDALILPRFRAKYDVWNATFVMPYHEFRHRVTAIATANLARIEGTTVTPIDRVPPGDIIVPVDDDDWFAPDLAAHLRRAFAPGAQTYLWTRATLEYDRPMTRIRRRMSRLLRGHSRLICRTNNYAVRNVPPLTAMALNNVRVSEYFKEHWSEVRQIPATLSLQNRSLGSQTTLAWRRSTISSTEIVRLLATHKTLYKSWRPTPDLQWAVPYVAQMDALMGELAVGGKGR